MPKLKEGLKSKFALKQKVSYTPKDASRDPCKRNAGKVGKVRDICSQNGYNFYLVKFGRSVWDEVSAREDELSAMD